MARPLRIEFPGALHHVTARGNAQQDIFLDDQDRQGFIEVLERVVSRFHLLLHAYCLMDNHFHLVVETPEGGKEGQATFLESCEGRHVGKPCLPLCGPIR